MNDFKITGLGVYGTLGGITVHIVKHRPNADCPIYEWYGRISMPSGVTMAQFGDRLDKFGIFDLWGKTINFDEYGVYNGQSLSHPLNIIEKKQLWSQLPPFAIRNLGKHITRGGTVVTVTSTTNPSEEGFTVSGCKSAYRKTRYSWRPDGTHHDDPTLAHPLDIVQPYSKLAMERRWEAAVREATRIKRKKRSKKPEALKLITDSTKEAILNEAANVIVENHSGLVAGAAALIFQHALSADVKEPAPVTCAEIERELDVLRAEQKRRAAAAIPVNPDLDPNIGRKDDQAKIRYELIPPEFLDGTADILTFGAKKYGDRNWEKGMAWSRVFGALMRHMWAWWRSEAGDPETGKSHLWHAACCLAFLMAYEERKSGQDDRPISTS